MSFDIASLSINESTVLHLTHPGTGEKLYADDAKKKPITITVGSTSSREYRDYMAGVRNRNLQRQRAAKGRDVIITPAEQLEEGLGLLTAVCFGAENLVYNGKAVKTSADFRELLDDPKMSWVKEQVDQTVGSVDVFIKESLTH